MTTFRRPFMAIAVFAALACQTAAAQTYSRTDTITYEDNLSLWVIGQQKTSTNVQPGGSIVEFSTEYDPATALPIRTYAFGKLQQTLTYDLTSAVLTGQRGTLKTVSDGRDTAGYDTTITLSGWKRGIPQLITYPGAKTASALVNNVGLIDWAINEVGSRTCYQYDLMGRMTKVTYPSEGESGACKEYNTSTNPSDWKPTLQAFVPVAASEYGIPAGHWKQTISTGDGFKVTYFDALWRPLVVESYDAGNAAATRSIAVTRYDGDGRPEFQSYPVATLGSYATITQGSRTSYDALGRPKRVEQDSELGQPLVTTTEYLAGFQTRVTNPRGYATTTSYKTYDTPSTDWPVAIAHPAGAYTDVERDIFGKPTMLTRRNADGTVREDRTYAYFADTQELCRVSEPETGATLTGYDEAGNLAWSASGLPGTTACDKEGDTATILARRTTRTYDARSRLSTLNFPDGIGDQVWTYTDDGLPQQIVTYNAAGHTVPVANAYSYNARRLLGGAGESISQDGWYSWGLGYGYDRNGNLSTHVYPVLGLTVDYAPNALGQPTKVGTFATGVSYYPNGAIHQFTYGNGLVHTLTQNARQLPLRSQDAYNGAAVLDDSYDYDFNGNVAAISDALTGNRGNRTMTYDPLDRLTDTTSPMYGTTGAHYTYDVLDNLTHVVAPGRDEWYCYDLSWRLTNLKTGNCSTGTSIVGLGYDVQGNLANKNGQVYAFDYGNRLRVVASKESYRYDGHGRRALAYSVQGLGNILSMYDQGGAIRFQWDARRGKYIEYLYLGGSLVASRETPIAGGSAVVKYQHTDALGTPVTVTDANRLVIERSEYEPFGKLLNHPIDDGPGFTGHVEDAATGLTYMQQRYYDPEIGRFLSTDPVSASSDPVNYFNRYKYANNNPYTFTDPDGRAFGIDDGAGFLIGGVVGLSIEVIKSQATGEPLTWGGATGAFVSGGIAGVGVVNIPETGGASLIAAGAINGAIAAGTGNVVKQGVDIATGDQQSFSGRELAINTAAGAVVGGAAEKLLPAARIPGVSSGRNSMKAVAQSVRTRIANGSASSMSARTAAKGAIGSQGANAYKTLSEAAIDFGKTKACNLSKGTCE